MRKIALAVFIVLLGTQVFAQSTGNVAPDLTLGKFERIRIGMTYKQVELIIGGKGDLFSKSGFGDIRLESYRWSDRDSRIIFASFSNGKLSTKSQFGIFATPVGNLEKTNSDLSMVKFERLRFGISYREAVSVIGSEGAENSAIVSQVRSFQWSGVNGSIVTILFSDGRLTVKMQSGLAGVESNRKLTFDQFAKIKFGLSYNDVESVLDGPGALQSARLEDNDEVRTFVWKGASETSISVEIGRQGVRSKSRSGIGSQPKRVRSKFSVANLTLSKFSRLEAGMSYTEVAGILGFEGESVFASEGESFEIETFQWKSPDNALVLVVFSNGKMTSVSQANLK